MARRVILDTGVLIAIERGRLDVEAVLGIDDALSRLLRRWGFWSAWNAPKKRTASHGPSGMTTQSRESQSRQPRYPQARHRQTRHRPTPRGSHRTGGTAGKVSRITAAIANETASASTSET